MAAVLADQYVRAWPLPNFGRAAFRATVEAVLEFLGGGVDSDRIGRLQLVAYGFGQRRRIDRRTARRWRHVLRRAGAGVLRHRRRTIRVRHDGCPVVAY